MAQELRQESRTIPILIGTSKKAARMREFATRAGAAEHTVLLQGETGSGKDQLAELIHYYGERTGPFVPVDCGALTETLSETELFGHMPGAFTDARTKKQGLVQVADNGTLFFNEIANMSLTLQAKFLRVLEKKTFRQVGGTKEIAINTRIIAASNVNLVEAVSRGTMRLDLFHRLSTIVFTVAPLRDRREDVPLLANYFLRRESEPKRFSKQAMEAMVEYGWPGNVRELKNVVARATFDSGDETEIQTEHLQLKEEVPVVDSESEAPWEKMFTAKYGFPTFVQMEERYYKELLAYTGGNTMRAARLSKLTRSTIYRKVGEFKLEGFVRELKS